VPFSDEATTQTQFQRVREACEARDRDPATMCWSNALVLCVGENEAELDRRAAAIGRDKAELRENGLAGTVSEVIDKIGRYAELGTGRVYLQLLDLADLDQVELIAAEVAPQLD
jgi:alkanesulfonate monooxygenase SsuD/methylene tetrahydromethanopterin reductase-like flavin-dependent oxidoreductase (luciferase family)